MGDLALLQHAWPVRRLRELLRPNPLVELFGSTLEDHGRAVATSEVLSGKTVGILFGAAWSGPSVNFQSKLSVCYQKFMKAKPAQVVFVSLDMSESDFESSMRDAPWLAVPYADEAIRIKLRQRFCVDCLPVLIIVDSNGKTCTRKGVAEVIHDPKCCSFPWNPLRIHNVLGNRFVDPSGKVTHYELDGETLGLCFCATSKTMLFSHVSENMPTLLSICKSTKAAGHQFQLVMCIMDKQFSDFSAHLAHVRSSGGNWPILPFDDRHKYKKLSAMYHLKGVGPYLVIVSSSGRLINANALRTAEQDPEAAAFPWPQPLVFELDHIPKLCSKPCICAFLEEVPAEAQQQAVDVLEKVAQESAEHAFSTHNEDSTYNFFVLRSLSHLASQVREACGLNDVHDPIMGSKQIVPNSSSLFCMGPSLESKARSSESSVSVVHAPLALVIDGGRVWRISEDIRFQTKDINIFIKNAEAGKVREQLVPASFYGEESFWPFPCTGFFFW